MIGKFSKNIAKSVLSEIAIAKQMETIGHHSESFHHLENAHVLGQESTWWHVKVHSLMFSWAIRRGDARECFGQIFRIIGAATKTAVGLVPVGNTGGSNVSRFKKLPIKPELQAAIIKAKGSV